MITDVKVCKNAINTHENNLSESEINSLTVKFIEKVLNVEKSDL